MTYFLWMPGRYMVKRGIPPLRWICETFLDHSFDDMKPGKPAVCKRCRQTWVEHGERIT